MRNAGCQLPEHGKFGGLHQFILSRTQRLFGTFALTHLSFQPIHHLGQIGRTFCDIALQRLICQFKQRLCFKAGFEHTPPLFEIENAKEQTCRCGSGQRSMGQRLRPNRPQAGEDQQAPCGFGEMPA